MKVEVREELLEGFVLVEAKGQAMHATIANLVMHRLTRRSSLWSK